MFELALHEWGVDPVVIAETWTDELLCLMVAKLAERKRAERGVRDDEAVSDEELFARTPLIRRRASADQAG
ncbi:MAG: hypothetical protein GHCLOJNM_01568 [bacterium]|nr:hypothetical protein [bacterium]